MERGLETPHKVHSDDEISVSDGEPVHRPASPAENDQKQSVPCRDSGEKRMRKLGIRRICSQAPNPSNKRARPRSSKDAMTTPVLVDRMGTGSQSMEDSSGDDDGTIQRSGHRVRKIKWNEDLTRVFLELFDRELAPLNYMQSMPYADGKMRIVRDFAVRTGIELPWESFKHKYDNLKRLYVAWEKLAGYSGVSIDCITGQITMNDEWWKDREQEVPLAKTLQRHPILHMELMHRVFKYHRVKRSSSSNVPPSPLSTPPAAVLHTVVVTSIDDLCKTVPVPDTTQPDRARATDPILPVASPVPRPREPISSEDPTTSTESPVTPSSSVARPSPARSRREQPPHAPSPYQKVTTPRNRRPCGRGSMGERREALVTFKEALSVLNEIGIAKFTDFWWASARILKEDAEWRETFLQFRSDGEKVEFLEGLSGFDRHSNFVGMKGFHASAGSSNCGI